MKYKRNVFSNILQKPLSTTHTRAFLLITTEQASYSYNNMTIITGKRKYYEL